MKEALKAVVEWGGAIIVLGLLSIWLMVVAAPTECPRCESLNTQTVESDDGDDYGLCHGCGYQWL